MDYRERAAAGAALLDRYDPQWAEKIETATLKLSDCYECVLGQLFGLPEDKIGYLGDPYTVGVYELGLSDEFPRIDGDEGASHLFGFTLEDVDDATGSEWLALQDAWAEQIALRQGA